MHHAAATGRPSINLDTWMLTREQVSAAVGAAVEPLQRLLRMLAEGRAH